MRVVLGIDVSTTTTMTMTAAGLPRPVEILASGGGTASALWRQILADVLGATISTPATTEGAAFGAALLAAVGAGWFPTVDDAVPAVVRAEPSAETGPEVARYAEIHARYRELYPALAPVFHGSQAAATVPRSAGGRPARRS